MPKHSGDTRPVGQVRPTKIPGTGTGKTAAPPMAPPIPLAPPEPTVADRLNDVLIQLGFDPGNWGESGSPYTIESLGPNRTVIQVNMPDRHVYVGVGADVASAMDDLETQVSGPAGGQS